MKRILLFVLIAGFFYNQASAQNATDKSEYQQAMEDVVADIQEAGLEADFQPFANVLERIAAVEKKEWLPQYWGAFCYMMKSFAEPVAEKKDLLLDKAEQLIAAADTLNPNNDEVEVLKANIASSRIVVDPMNRWQRYGALSAMAIAKAKSINPANPRIALHEAQGVFYTPEAYGGGKIKALPLIKTAIEQFAAFKPASAIMPNWGAPVAEYMLAEAQK
ncbi:MAG: hypothetical protein IT262_22470 [Saprospiraceae bacterium]|nr:hypothetical protein [Saprospiraceae bacterium]